MDINIIIDKLREMFPPNRIVVLVTFLTALAGFISGLVGVLPTGWENYALIATALIAKVIVGLKFLEGSQKYDKLASEEYIQNRSEQWRQTLRTSARGGVVTLDRPLLIGETAADDEPGDDDQFPDVPVADPAHLAEDLGESPEMVAELLAAIRDESQAPMASYSGLSAAHRVTVRHAVRQAIDLSFRRSGDIAYTQGPQRWFWKSHRWFASKGAVPRNTDCSGWATWVLYQGLRLFHVRDVVNGQHWLAGYTGTMLRHGKVVHNHDNIQLGDLAIYDGHVAVCIGGDYVASHGSPGVHKLPLNYRSDLVAVVRCI